MTYPMFIFAALFLLESGRIRNAVPFSLANAHSAHGEALHFWKQ